MEICSKECIKCRSAQQTKSEHQHVRGDHNRIAFLHQRGKSSRMLVGAEGWSASAEPSEPLLGGFDPTVPPLPSSLSPEGHVNEEEEDEAALIWVMWRSESKQSGVTGRLFKKESTLLTNVGVTRNQRCSDSAWASID